MTALRILSYRTVFVGVVLGMASLLIAWNAEAQRPSIAEMQEQIEAIIGDYDEASGQVKTVLDILPVFQDAVAETYIKYGVAPTNRTMAGLSANATDTETSFISAVDIVDGVVVFTFGNDAHPDITGKVLAFAPYASADSTVVWRCGDDPMIAGVTLIGGFQNSTIPDTAYPRPCILKSHAAGPDKTIAAQVKSALDILEVFQDAVASAFFATGTAPTNRTVAGLSSEDYDTQTRYIEQVDVVNGAIVVTYGNEANVLIQGQELVLTPYLSVDSTIVWRCNDEPIIPGVSQMPGSYYSGYNQVYARYLPRPCATKAHASNTHELIREQVLEAFDVVERFQAAVEAAGVDLGTATAPVPPANRTEAGMTSEDYDTTGNYFEAIDINNGIITVRYGSLNANALIYDQLLSWTPYESADGTIVWVCGTAYPVPGTSPMGSAAGVPLNPGSAYNSVDDIFLPAICRQ